MQTVLAFISHFLRTHGLIQKILSGRVLSLFFLVINIKVFPEACVTLCQEAIVQGSVPVFLRKPIAPCDFPGGGGLGVDLMSPLDPPLEAYSTCKCI